MGRHSEINRREFLTGRLRSRTSWRREAAVGRDSGRLRTRPDVPEWNEDDLRDVLRQMNDGPPTEES